MGGSAQQRKKSKEKKVSKKSHHKKSNKKSHVKKSSKKKKSHEKKQSKKQNLKHTLNSGPKAATSTQMNPPMPNPPVPNAPAPYYPAPNGPQYGAPPYQPAPGPYAPAPYGAPSMAAPPMYAPPAPAPVVVPVVMAPPPPRALVDPNCPPGLEYLTQVDQLVVIQEVDMLQVFTGYESHNRYSVKNAANQNVYYCVETSDVLTMNLMHSDRPFEIIVMDNFGVPVLRASRPYHFGSILCGCPDLLQVSTGNGQPLGTVQEQFKCCGSRFTVHDANGGVVLFLEGPPCRFDFLDTEFEVLTTDEAKVGAVTRQFPGIFKELYTKADVFGVHFPVDLQVEVKALLLCSTFLIDFMFYQQKDNEKNDGGFGGSSSNDSNNDRGRSRSPRRSVSRNSPDVDMNMGLGNSMDVDMNMGL